MYNNQKICNDIRLRQGGDSSEQQERDVGKA